MAFLPPPKAHGTGDLLYASAVVGVSILNGLIRFINSLVVAVNAFVKAVAQAVNHTWDVMVITGRKILAGVREAIVDALLAMSALSDVTVRVIAPICCILVAGHLLFQVSVESWLYLHTSLTGAIWEVLWSGLGAFGLLTMSVALVISSPPPPVPIRELPKFLGNVFAAVSCMVRTAQALMGPALLLVCGAALSLPAGSYVIKLLRVESFWVLRIRTEPFVIGPVTVALLGCVAVFIAIPLVESLRRRAHSS